MATEAIVEHMEGKENEEPKAAEQKIDSSSGSDPVPEAEEKTDQKSHPPAVIEVEKVHEVPVLDVVAVEKDLKPDVSSFSESSAKDEVTEAHPETPIAPVSVVESVEKLSDAPHIQEPVSDVEIKPELTAEESEIVKEPVVLPSEIKNVAEENPKQVESESKEVEMPKTVQVEGTPPAQAEKVEEVNISEKDVPTEITKEKQEQVEKIEEVENTSEKVVPKETTEEPAKGEGLLITKPDELSESSIENKTSSNEVPVSDESSNTLASSTPSASTVVSDIPDKVHLENVEKEATEFDKVEKPAKEDSLDVPIAEEIVINNAKSTAPETAPTEVAGESTPVEVTEKPLVDQEVPLDVEVVTGEKTEETSKDDVAPSVISKEEEPQIPKTEEGYDNAKKTNEGEELISKTEAVTEENKDNDTKNDIALAEITKEIEPQAIKTEDGNDSKSEAGDAEKSFEGEKVPKDVGVVTEEKEDVKAANVDVVSTVETARELIPETIGSDLEPKTEENDGEKLAKTAEVTEESAETTEDPSKQGVPAKKHSNGIISKVKQSIVKVKKAIIGKSPSSKTINSDVKDDINVK